jgi:D-galactarolactone cycloisomerase
VRISKVETSILQAPEDDRPHWVSHFIVPRVNELLVRLQTDEGVFGFGLATCYSTVEPVVKAINSGVTAEVVGCDPLAPERVYEKLFSLTAKRLAHEKGWSRDALLKISAAVDLACWDIIGKTAGLPLYQLFGGYRDRVPCYVTCAYYRDGKDEAELRDEIQALKGQGHRGFKAKVGGLSVAEDIERLEIVRDVIGGGRGQIW